MSSSPVFSKASHTDEGGSEDNQLYHKRRNTVKRRKWAALIGNERNSYRILTIKMYLEVVSVAICEHIFGEIPVYYYKNDHPYRRIPVRRVNRRNGFGTPVRPNRDIEVTDQLEQEVDPAKPEVPQATPKVEEPITPTQPAKDEQDATPSPAEPDWKALALSLQTEMGNFRKRQSRRADGAVAAERDRLLRQTLTLADNLERALSQDLQAEGALLKGVELTYRELVRQLEAEGVTRLETLGHAFDPNIHEALATVPDREAEPNTIIEEVEAGYMLRDKLLRPARVVVVGGSD
jgi:molecular chaperone GrpE